MSIAITKLDLAKKIIDTDNKAIINHIKAIFETRVEEDWFESLPEDVQASVEQGVKEADSGQGTPHAVVMKNVRKWLRK